MLRRRSSSRKELAPKDVMKKLLDFLQSPIWALPIATFIEQRSIVFERSYGDSALNEYHNIHEEFAGLVTNLFECFCDDAGVQEAQLRSAVGSLDTQKLNAKQKAALEPVAAANDFDVFVPMMMRKNVELQLQALQMIEFMCGAIPSALQLQEGKTLKNKKMLSAEDTERYVLIAVLRQSKEEFDARNAEELRENLDMLSLQNELERQRLEEARLREEQLAAHAMDEHTMQLAPKRPPTAVNGQRPASSKAPHVPRPVSRKVTEPKSEAKKSEKIEKKPGVSGASDARPPSQGRKASATPKSTEDADKLLLKDIRRPSLPARHNQERDGVQAEQDDDPGAEFGPRRKNVKDVHALLHEPSRLNSADVANRREYLQQQRDKLLAMKQAEREKQLQEVTSKIAVERPRTAKAARGAMRGSSEEAVAARRALAEKLKTEVVTL